MLNLGWFYGDPHFHTVDGVDYTFNGLGEYTLVETTDKNFTLQGRTSRIREYNGVDDMLATVFSAFAAQDSDSDTFQIEMNRFENGKNQYY